MHLTCQACHTVLDLPDGAPGPAYACPTCRGTVPVPGRAVGEAGPRPPADPLPWAWGALAVLAVLSLLFAAVAALNARPNDVAPMTAPLWVGAVVAVGYAVCRALDHVLKR